MVNAPLLGHDADVTLVDVTDMLAGHCAKAFAINKILLKNKREIFFKI
jgi:hypothetical protein